MAPESPVKQCPDCGAHNRIPLSKLAAPATCGRCKKSLPPWAEPIDVDEQAFDILTKQTNLPILIDFWAAWCGPCRMASPHVKQVARDAAGKALVLKVNTEENPGLASRFGVQGIPNFVVMKGGRVVQQNAGLVDAATMRQWLKTVE